MVRSEAGTPEQVYVKEQQWQVYKSKYQKEFCREQLRPFIGSRDPKLAIADERLGMHRPQYQKCPSKHEQSRGHPGPEPDAEKAAHSKSPGAEFSCGPATYLVPPDRNGKQQTDSGFPLLTAKVFEEDVPGLTHQLRSSIRGLSRLFAIAIKIERSDMGLKVTFRAFPSRCSISELVFSRLNRVSMNRTAESAVTTCIQEGGRWPVRAGTTSNAASTFESDRAA